MADPNSPRLSAYNDMSVIYNNEAAMRRTEKVVKLLVDIMDAFNSREEVA